MNIHQHQSLGAECRMKAQGAEKRGFGFLHCMRFREQIGTQVFGWNVRLEAMGKLDHCFYTLPVSSKNNGSRKPNASLQLLPEAEAQRTR
jgi:hypothetical protein